ncbi:hypothetical protein PCCS19_44730 [Paenibacillus sp. CCS19]|uniref:DUF2269 family protein n=1 Tax=Paenibacillus sp. CCS19 TaxID=3158387 RepID=UPI002560EFA6|nr:DUF2269 family protein [Paenibacillus cellulosilyticus]GMK41417.1 hypothetical protein PCCS19_44730 [Paenibacillus cellulosilyticus]
MFGLLLVLHILASIAIIGPTFMMPLIRRFARNLDQLLFSLELTTKLAIITKVGGTILIITGIWLMFITRMGITQMWLNVSILLSLLTVVMLDGWIEPRMKKITKLISESQDKGDEVPAEFGLLMKRIIPIETTAQLLMITILVLMVVKPF